MSPRHPNPTAKMNLLSVTPSFVNGQRVNTRETLAAFLRRFRRELGLKYVEKTGYSFDPNYDTEESEGTHIFSSTLGKVFSGSYGPTSSLDIRLISSSAI